MMIVMLLLHLNFEESELLCANITRLTELMKDQ